MYIYDYTFLDKAYVFGNITKSFDNVINSIQKNIKHNNAKSAFLKRRDVTSEFNNSAIIFCGNIGLINVSDEKIQKTFMELNENLVKNKTFLFFVRGNEENPSLYYETKYDFSNIKFIQDYSIIKLDNFNCLCIGGGVSMDRAWKIKQEKRYGKKYYYENEATNLNEEMVRKNLNEYAITTVISFDAPSFFGEKMRNYKENKWIKNDESLLHDIVENRLKLDFAHNEMIKLNNIPYLWYCIRESSNNGNQFINDIYFTNINLGFTNSVNNTILNLFNVHINDSTKVFLNNESKESNDEVSICNEYVNNITATEPIEMVFGGLDF